MGKPLFTAPAMGGRKGKAPQRLEGPKKLASGEQESRSVSAEGLPSGEPQQGRSKAQGARSELEPATMGGQGTSGGHRKPKRERNSGGRRPGAGPPPTQGRQGSERRRGCEPNSRHPGDSRAGQQKEESLRPGEGRTGKRGRLKRRGKGQAPSALTLDGDTSGGDPGSFCLDSEAHEAQESGSQSGGDPELRPHSGQKDTGSGGSHTGSESGLEQGELLSSDGRSTDEPPAGPRSLEGSSETGTQGATEDSGADTESGPEEPGPGRGPRAAPGLASRGKEAEEAKLDRKATASSPLEGNRTCVLQSSRASQDPTPAQDTSDKEVQREAGPGGAEQGGAKASTAGTRRRQVGKVVGQVQAATSESEAGAGGADGPGDPAPLGALVALHRLCARPPPGPTPQAPGPRRADLKERFVRAAQALNLLRWLWRRLQSPAGDGRGAGPRAGPRAGETRGRGPRLRRRLALRLAGVAGLGGRPRAPPGCSSSSSQAAKSPVRDDPSEDGDLTPDPKFAVVLPRIHKVGRAARSRSSEEASADVPAGEDRIWPYAGASRDSEGLGTSGEGEAQPRRGSLLAPNPPDDPQLDESRCSSEAEPETLEAETPVHWAQGSDTREDPELGTHMLLPQLTLERSQSPCGCQRERWEPEDEAEAALERDLELSLGPGLEVPSFPGAEGRSLGDVLEDTEDLARLR